MSYVETNYDDLPYGVVYQEKGVDHLRMKVRNESGNNGGGEDLIVNLNTGVATGVCGIAQRVEEKRFSYFFYDADTILDVCLEKIEEE